MYSRDRQVEAKLRQHGEKSHMRTPKRRPAFPRPVHVTSGERGRTGRARSAGRLCARCQTRLPPPIDPRSAPQPGR
ncbi:Hypothetical predicted protein [Marmota monax]|nr:hypothetical protein GHT09_007980 [Marmota monax]VTJ68467.1 Hypothetical predicted protein [Marmota monax]